MAYVCTNCGLEYVKWQGKCDACKEWNRLTSFATKGSTKHFENQQPINYPQRLDEIQAPTNKRLLAEDAELNRVLGGGIVPGSLVLLGGEPGIGKSTLLLQMALQFKEGKVLYVSGEETTHQIKLRTARLGLSSANCLLLQECGLVQILKHTNDLEPTLLIIDSIQTLYAEEEEGAVGSINQIKACTTRLLHYAKSSNVALFLIGHINKDGALAGPKLLEHMVDTVLQFEGDKPCLYRMVRTIKNRFGPTSELGIYEMKVTGLHGVQNPASILLSGKDYALSGIAIGSCLEGTRPLMLEVQALVTATRYGNPQRNATGYDPRRLNMLLAVLEKRTGIRLHDRDVFLNITGGLRVDDTALDLAICMAVIGSLKDQVISNLKCFIAEVGLGGELRNVQRMEYRIAEAEKLGFKEVFITAQHQQFAKPFNIKINPIKNLKEFLSLLFS
ncbi:MAG: DNA repair protein RadA [Candidatus Cardinium sp.]|uniref:DNA repair protein RadA n=1 Tax=Cardinium endosymbiont of Dermatophagoides farinae TaxID=2597823 RepID=UPI00118298A8|nr:DNA repair protein RadA [Cardinium endosymbiont of Dermatophagoides farinae]TSJ80811.1 DNA repair protein RadA [Cardinium endosymbiont of Dermatophagoides farinae]UWW96815.1 MAG: DNA repair protein RadA [Candidatus Cardinium sp.]